MKSLGVIVAAALLSLGLASPVAAKATTEKDAQGDVTVVHSGFEGNQDIDIWQVRVQYQNSDQSDSNRIRARFTLRDARPELESFQAYWVEFKEYGTRHRLIGNSEGRGKILYWDHENHGWSPSMCPVKVHINDVQRPAKVTVTSHVCYSDPKIRLMYARTESYYDNGFGHLASWDRVALKRDITES